ncbi:hypothetical protein AB0H16_37030, partial [Streptomyces lydicus]|uniref:hypothetical protein n=1 Tax=Streptomyces lydicus TaxID=47763 RepID=UPI0033BFFDEB
FLAGRTATGLTWLAVAAVAVVLGGLAGRGVFLCALTLVWWKSFSEDPVPDEQNVRNAGRLPRTAR